jgi:drug/metabolite transporter (DMT)-like permease
LLSAARGQAPSARNCSDSAAAHRDTPDIGRFAATWIGFRPAAHDNIMTDKGYFKGIAAAVTAALLWSLSGIFSRLMESTDPWQLNAWRGLSTGILLGLYLVFVYRRRLPAQLMKIEPMALLACAGFFAAGSTFYLTALEGALVANVSCLTASAPVFAALLSWIFLRERGDGRIWLATILAIGGIAVIFMQGVAFNQQNLIGNVVALLTAFCFAGQTVALRRYRSVDMVPAIAIGAIAVFLTLGVAMGNLPISAHDLQIVLLMGAVQLAAPIALYVYAARHVSAMQLSLISLLDVVFNPLWAWIGVGEVPERNAFIGGAVIVGAVLLTLVRRPQRQPTAAQ